MADTKIFLGEFEFTGFEVPEKINLWSGEQRTAKSIALGGVRNIMSLGRNDDDISFSGLFFGSTAYDRVKYLHTMRIAGNPLEFTIWDQSYRVILKRVEFSIERRNKIPYTITLEIIEELSNPTTPLLAGSYTGAIWDLITEAFDIYNLIEYVPLYNSLVNLSNYVNSLLPNQIITTDIIENINGYIGDSARIVSDLISGIDI